MGAGEWGADRGWIKGEAAVAGPEGRQSARWIQTSGGTGGCSGVHPAQPHPEGRRGNELARAAGWITHASFPSSLSARGRAGLVDMGWGSFFSPLAVPLNLQDLSSPARDWTQAPAMKMLSPNHWTAREVPGMRVWVTTRSSGSAARLPGLLPHPAPPRFPHP